MEITHRSKIIYSIHGNKWVEDLEQLLLDQNEMKGNN